MLVAAVAYLTYTDRGALVGRLRKHRPEVAAAFEDVGPTAEAILEKAPAVTRIRISEQQLSTFNIFSSLLRGYCQLTRPTSLSVLAACVHLRGTRACPFSVRGFQSREGSFSENSVTKSPEARCSLTSLSSIASMMKLRQERWIFWGQMSII